MSFNLKLIFFSWIIFSNIALFVAQYRIVGGTDVADDEDIPYQISLQIWKRSGRWKHFCGGSIVNPTHILTAAHCLEKVEPHQLSVLAGVRDLNDTTGQRSNVISFVRHEDYKELVSGDIAVVNVDPPFKLDGIKVDKIDVSGLDRVGAGANVMITGWGSMNRNITYPVRMQKLIFKTISNQICKKRMINITSAEVCAYSGLKDHATCIGDSGGPLVMRKGSKLHQIGVVSYGNRKCGYNGPNVFTRISAFADWIRRKIM